VKPVLGRATAWCAIGAFAVAAYMAVVLPGEQQRRSLIVQARDCYDLAGRDDALLRQRMQLRAMRARVESDLRQLRAMRTGAGAVLASLVLLDHEARAQRVAFRALTPGPSAGQGRGKESITFALRGPYRSVLHVIADLSEENVLLEIGDARLEVQQDSGAQTDAVAATIQATLYHGIRAVAPTAAPLEDEHAAATTR
jgi:hypothetical protein